MDNNAVSDTVNVRDRKHLIFRIAFFAGAIVINFILPRAAGALGLPLYLDNVGTLVAAVLGGYLPGIAVGYLNNIINMQGNPGNAYYVVLSTLIAAGGTYLGKKGWFDKLGMECEMGITIILKVADCCNYKCSFCRYTKQIAGTDNSLMDLILAKETILKAVKYNKLINEDKLHIIFHGGEPLLWGKENFGCIIDFEKELEKDYNVTFYNSIQTNAALIDEEWINIFQKMDMDVGVSIDGPADLNFHKDINGSDSINKIKLLKERSVKYGILSVITDEHCDRFQEYYDFLKKNDIHSVGLCFCYDTIGNESVKNENLNKFLVGLFDLYFYGKYQLRIREFDNAISKILTGRGNSCKFCDRKKCGNYFSVFPSGTVCFCDSYGDNSYVIGNIKNNDFADIKNSMALANILNDVKAGHIKCLECNVKDVCGGGCYRNDINKDNNYFCQTYLGIYSHIKNAVIQYKEGREY